MKMMKEGFWNAEFSKSSWKSGNLSLQPQDTAPHLAATNVENQTSTSAAIGLKCQCLVSDSQLPHFSSFPLRTKCGKVVQISICSPKQSRGMPILLSAHLQLPHFTSCEQDKPPLFSTRRLPHPYACPESQPNVTGGG